MTACWTDVTTSPAETLALGRALGELVRGGDVIALNGPLGAGKTQLVKGLAAGLGVADDEPIVSPTFVLVREYVGRLRLFHLDAYRLSGAEDLLALGFEEMCANDNAVIAVEWAERVAYALPPHALHIELAHAGGDRREVRLACRDATRAGAWGAAFSRTLAAIRPS